MANIGKVYPSKKDTWIVLLMWATVLGTVFGNVMIFKDTRSPIGTLAFALFCTLPVIVLCLGTLLATRYTLTHKELLIRCGPFKHRIPLKAIQEVKPQRTPLSSPALSLDRIHIKFEGSKLGIYISPENRKAFYRDLVSRTGLKQSGDKLVLEDAPQTR